MSLHVLMSVIILATLAWLSPSDAGWNVEEERSKIDDSTNVYARLESIEPIHSKLGRPYPMEIMVACRERKTAIFIVFAGHFMSSHAGGGIVTYRIDSRPVQRKEFANSSDHKALGLWSGAQSIPFIKELIGASKLLIRATPFSETPVTAEFDISGAEDALSPLRKACGWPSGK
jgi:type VI secretion system protein VasI